MLSVIGSVLALYVVLRVVWPLRLPRALRVTLALLVFAVALHHRIVARFAGSMASPEIPKMAIATLASGFTALLLGAVFLLVADALLLASRLLRSERGRAVFGVAWLRPGIGVLALALGVFGVSQGMAVPEPRHVEVEITGLPAVFDGYRVLQLTDIHASRLLTGEWVRDVVAEGNALQPDLVVITGDRVDGTVQARANDYRPLGELRAVDGVIAIAGNHEYYAQYHEWMQAFRGLGMGHIIGMDQLVKRANGGFVSGRYRVGDMVLYVSNGAGLWPGFAARIGVPSEITLLTLRAPRPTLAASAGPSPGMR